MNLAFLAALVTAILGALLAAIDEFSDSTTVDGPIYWIVIFLAFSFFFLGLFVGKTRLNFNE